MTTKTSNTLGSLLRSAAIWLAWRLAGLGLILALLGCIAAIITYFVITPRSFDLAEIERANRIPGMTYLDKNGALLATRGAYHADPVVLEDLPPYVVEAFLSTEDRRFFNHWGVDPRGLTRAIIANLRAGRLVQGGSTITQQLAKNLFLNGDRTMSRKFKEVFYAVWLERHLTKDQILTIYLNRIYMGAGTYGLNAASDYYFGKPASEVTLAEAAMLAGLPKAPSSYAPTSNLESAQKRAAHVLENMVEARFMNEAQIADALANPAEVAGRAKLGAIQYFLDYVHELLPTLVEGTTEDLVITTTLDTDLQFKAETAMRAALHRRDACKDAREAEEDATNNRVSDGEILNADQGALVTYAPDGALRALVGGRCYTDSQFNRATQARRQPGSSFKPFVSSNCAGKWLHTRHNRGRCAHSDRRLAANQLFGFICRAGETLRQALANSINTVSARLTEDVTPEKVVETAKRMGIQTELPALYSISLGTVAVSPQEMTAAFIPFATTGLSATPHAVLKIVNASGDTIYEFEAEEPVRIVEKKTAADMNNMLFQVMYAGTGRNARLGARPAAGKTGTSQDWRDAWFVGYSADYITGVWVGNDDDSSMEHVTGGGLPAQIWREYMLGAHKGIKISALPGAKPAQNKQQTAELRSFYNELISDLANAGGGKRPAVGTNDNSRANPNDCRPRWLPWCN